MVNGSHALQLLAPEPPPAAVDKQVTEIEVEIGRAVAAGVIAIAWGIDDYATEGRLSPSTETWAGGMLGHVAQLRLDALGSSGPDFREVAFRCGRRALQGRPDAFFLARLGRGQVDAVIDELIGHVLDISSKVIDSELRFRAN